MSTGPLPTAASAGSPAAKPWITNGTRWRIHRTSDNGSRPCSCAAEAERVDQLDDALLGLVAEHADGDHARRQPVQDLRDGLGHHLARAARREHEAEGVGTEGDGEQRVLLVGDPTDLDPHRGRGYRTPSRAPAYIRGLMETKATPQRGAAWWRGASPTGSRSPHPRCLPRAARAGDDPDPGRARAAPARLRRVRVRRHRTDRPPAARSGIPAIPTGTTTWRGSCTSATSS